MQTKLSCVKADRGRELGEGVLQQSLQKLGLGIKKDVKN